MLRDKLNRLGDEIVPPKSSRSDDSTLDRYQKIAVALKGRLHRAAGGTYVRRVTDFDDQHALGHMTVGDLKPIDRITLPCFEPRKEAESYRLDRMLFFDMETTGLGGSGTVAFLIGFGSVTADGFQVRQYFLPDYPDEEAMLEAVHAEIDPESIIVSYNGKSFDIPILQDRLVLQRIDRNLKFAAHLDLLHPVRRLYRRRLRYCNLANIEREVFGLQRYNDIPGELIPAVYFNWLTNDDTELLDRVMDHHIQDIATLYFLVHHLAAVQDDPRKIISDPDDVFSLARMFEKRREFSRVCRMLDDFTEITESNDRHDIVFMHSLAHKRNNQIERAVALWETLIGHDGPEALAASIELAKYYEHRLKDYKKALELTLAARAVCPENQTIQADIKKRINRLERKLAARRNPQ